MNDKKIPKRGLSVVLNGIDGDSRVIKSARAMSRVMDEVVLLGMYRSSEDQNSLKETRIGGIKYVLVPWEKVETQPLKEESTEEQKLRDYLSSFTKWEKRVLDFVVDYKPEVIHSHDYLTIRLGHQAKRELNKQGHGAAWVHDVHEYLHGLLDIPDGFKAKLFSFGVELEQQHIEMADHVFTVSEQLQKKLQDNYPALKRVEVIHNAPEMKPLANFDGQRLREKLGIGDRLLGAYVGNVKEKRGVHLAIRLLTELHELEIAIVTNSKNTYVDSIKSLAEEIGVAERVHWHPYVDPGHIVGFLDGVDIGLIPITKYGNADVSLPNKLFELGMAGAKILSADLDSIKEFLNDNQIGKITDFHDTKRAAKDLLSLIREPESKANLNKIEALRSSYSWEVQESKLIETYRRLMGYQPSKALNFFSTFHTSKGLRILHGLSGAAGQPSQLSAALNRIPNFSSQSLQISASNFHYPSDLIYLPNRSLDKNLDSARLMSILSGKFDVFHFHFRSFFHDPINLQFPALWDLIALKAAGKVIVFHFRGTEARLDSDFRDRNPHHYHDDPEHKGILNKFPEKTQRKFIDLVTAISDIVFVVDPELLTYVPSAKILERCIEIDDWPMVGVKENKKPLIVHAPSRRHIKGTKFILDAVSQLHRENYSFDFKLVEGLSNSEAREWYKKADIIIDQLRIGWYGVLAVEAMALGKPVVSYIREDLVTRLGDEMPLANANPSNIHDVLRDLLGSFEKRKLLSTRARDYVEKTHDSNMIARRLAKHYEDAMSEPKKVDLEPIIDLLNSQIAASVTDIDKQQNPPLRQQQNPPLRQRILIVFRQGGVGLLFKVALAKIKKL